MQLPINQMDQRKNRVDFMDNKFKQLVIDQDLIH